jgi:uncharacterized membrane protein YebE (DUF533 family)
MRRRAGSRLAGARADDWAVPDAGLLDVLGEKVLLGWLRNRFQLLFPFAVDLRRLEPAHIGLVADMVVASAHADGSFDAGDGDRVAALCGRFQTGPALAEAVERALQHPKPLHTILSKANDIHVAALLFAVSLMVVDQRNAANRHYLKYLAARLQLPPGLAESLEQRYRSPA